MLHSWRVVVDALRINKKKDKVKIQKLDPFKIPCELQKKKKLRKRNWESFRGFIYRINIKVIRVI